jgi:hypothetical protein
MMTFYKALVKVREMCFKDVMFLNLLGESLHIEHCLPRIQLGFSGYLDHFPIIRVFLKNKRLGAGAGGEAQVVELLPSKCKVSLTLVQKKKKRF